MYSWFWAFLIVFLACSVLTKLCPYFKLETLFAQVGYWLEVLTDFFSFVHITLSNTSIEESNIASMSSHIVNSSQDEVMTFSCSLHQITC
jgi:hypothetical protein